MTNLFEVNNLTISTEAEKFQNDFQTPHNVCKYMASLIPQNSTTILEPTAGIGNLIKAAENEFLNRNIVDYHITAPNDYFTMEKERFDCIIMNPPFSSKSAFIENAPLGVNKFGMRLGYLILTECMSMSDNIIALMPWFTISDSDVRLRFIKDFGLKSVTALPRKTFKYARIQTVILELNKGYNGITEFKVFDRL